MCRLLVAAGSDRSALGAAEPPRGTFAGSAAGVAGAACFWSGMGATVFPAFDAMVNLIFFPNQVEKLHLTI